MDAADGVLLTEIAFKTNQLEGRGTPKFLKSAFVRAAHIYRTARSAIERAFITVGLISSISVRVCIHWYCPSVFILLFLLFLFSGFIHFWWSLLSKPDGPSIPSRSLQGNPTIQNLCQLNLNWQYICIHKLITMRCQLFRTNIHSWMYSVDISHQIDSSTDFIQCDAKCRTSCRIHFTNKFPGGIFQWQRYNFEFDRDRQRNFRSHVQW